MKTVAEALAHGRAALCEIEGGARDARWLLASALGVGRERLSLLAEMPVAPEAAARFHEMLAARAARVPVAHLTGERAFYGRTFHVTRDVLDPRPETETLVAACLEAPFTRVLDLGTGSGAILLTLLAEVPGAIGLGTDRSGPALAVAARNARNLGLEARATVQEADWFAGVAGRYDLIVSNPPYIAEAEMAELAPELAHEPRGALSDGGDGLSAYRAIFGGAAGHLAEGGRIAVEFGAGQGAQVAAIARSAGWPDTTFRADLDGRDRVLVAHAP